MDIKISIMTQQTYIIENAQLASNRDIKNVNRNRGGGRPSSAQTPLFYFRALFKPKHFFNDN